jgi:hypothetical protein
MILNEVIIDDHYRMKHSDSIDDRLILELMQLLNGGEFEPNETNPPYEYFASLIRFEGKQYRLVWLLENYSLQIGIINCYRDDRKE